MIRIIHVHLARIEKHMELTDNLAHLHLGESYKPRKFKIGLDYGTTFSSRAWCLASGSSLHLKCERIWAFYGYSAANRSSKLKNTEIPSEIFYLEDGINKIGADATEWQRKPGHRVRRAKLGLDERPLTRV